MTLRRISNPVCIIPSSTIASPYVPFKTNTVHLSKQAPAWRTHSCVPRRDESRRGTRECAMPHTFLSRPLTRSFANVWCCAASCLEAVGRLSNPRQMHGGHFDRRRRRNKTHVECFGCRQNKKVGGITQECVRHVAAKTLCEQPFSVRSDACRFVAPAGLFSGAEPSTRIRVCGITSQRFGSGSA